MPRADRNRNFFASAIAGSTSGSTTSRRTRAGTDPNTPFVVREEEDRATTRTETSNSSNYILFIDILILLLKILFIYFLLFIGPQGVSFRLGNNTPMEKGMTITNGT